MLCALAAAPAANAADGSAPSSLWAILYQGLEWPAWFILLGSFAAIALIVEHFLVIRPVSIAPPGQIRKARQQIERSDFRGCLDSLKKSHTFFAQIMSAALSQARHGFDAMHEAALQRSSELAGQMYRKCEYLNILGNLGPLMGLLGTVWGMIVAFNDLGRAGGQAGGAGELARGISLALVNTLLGLMLAIVGLGFFGVCRNRIESFTTHAAVETLNLLEYFRPAPSGAKFAEPRAIDTLQAPAPAAGGNPPAAARPAARTGGGAAPTPTPTPGSP